MARHGRSLLRQRVRAARFAAETLPTRGAARRSGRRWFAHDELGRSHMTFEREPQRPRSSSDPTAAERQPPTPGSRTLTEALPARRGSLDGHVAGPRAPIVPRTEVPDPAQRARMLQLFGTPEQREAAAAHAEPAEAPPDSPASEPASELSSELSSGAATPLQHPLAMTSRAASPAHSETGATALPEIADDVTALPAVEAAAAGGGAPAAARSSPEFAKYLKADSYLVAAIGTLVSMIGWILLRRIPLMQPVGQQLSSALKNAVGAMDDAYKGNRPKAIGQGISAGAQLAALSGSVAGSKAPKGSTPAEAATQIADPHTNAKAGTALRSGGAGSNAVGMAFTGVGEYQTDNPAKAAFNAVGAVLNAAGVVGFAIETSGKWRDAFLALEGINAFNNASTPIGGVIDDARKSKVKNPWLRDPKVVGQELAAVGLALNGVASTLNKTWLIVDKEMGTDKAQRLAPLLMALGTIGMFLATVGYGVSAYGEMPKKPAGNDAELAEVPQDATTSPSR
jgi:hypothetical protein